MKARFKEYLQTFDFYSDIEGVIPDIFRITEKMHNFKIEEIFISNINEDFANIGSVIFFNSRYIVEFNNIFNPLDFYLTPYKNLISECRIISEYFSFEKTSKESSLKIKVYLDPLTHLNLEAKGNNCLHLIDIYQRYLIPNLKVGSGVSP